MRVRAGNLTAGSVATGNAATGNVTAGNLTTVNILGTRGIPAAHGGFETFVEALALHLDRQGHRVRVYCQGRGALSRRERTWNGIELVEISLPLGGALSTVVFDLLSTIDVVRRGGTVLTCGYNTSPFFLLYRLFGVRNVVNMDGIEWRRPKWSAPARLWLWCCERIGLHLADEVIADHPEIAKHLLRRTFQRVVHVVPYGTATPPPVDSSALAKHGLELKRYATVVARPEPENSILEIVEAWSRRPRGMPLVIVGDYEGEANAWRTRVKDAAGDEVKFIGEVRGGDELSSLRRGACLYIHGHTVGGTNPSALEALAAGNPVLAHDNPFNRWVLADAAVYFTDRDSCARALDGLLGDQAILEKLGTRALELAKERFGLETCHLAYERLLTDSTLLSSCERMVPP